MHKFISIFIISFLFFNVPTHSCYGLENERPGTMVKTTRLEEISKVSTDQDDDNKKSKFYSNTVSYGAQLVVLVGGVTTLNYLQSPETFTLGSSLMMSIGGPYLISNLMYNPLKRFFGGIGEYCFPSLYYKEFYLLETEYNRVKDKLSINQRKKIRSKLDVMREIMSDYDSEPQAADKCRKKIQLMLGLYASLQTKIQKIDMEVSLPKLKKTLENYDTATQKIVLEFAEQIAWSSQHHDFEVNGIKPFAKKCMVWRGEPGTGKTTLAEKFAKDLNLSFEIVRLKGKDQGELSGQPELNRYDTGAELKIGQIARAMINAGIKNPVILIDDAHLAVNSQNNEIGPLLLELLDPNKSTFMDEALGEIDVGGVSIILTVNKKFTGEIAQALNSRAEPHEFSVFSPEQKIKILKSHYEDYSKKCEEGLKLKLPSYENVKGDLDTLIKKDKDENGNDRGGVRELIESSFKPYMMKKINEVTKKEIPDQKKE